MKILLYQDLLFLPSRDDAQWASRALLPALATAGHSCRALVPAFGPPECPTRTHYFGVWAEHDFHVAWASAEADVYEVSGAEVHALLKPESRGAYLAAQLTSFEPDVLLLVGSKPADLLADVPPDIPARVIFLSHRRMTFEGEAADGGKFRLDAVAVPEVTLAQALTESNLEVPVNAVALPFLNSADVVPIDAAEGELVVLPEASAEGGVGLFLELAQRLPEVEFATALSSRATAEEHAAVKALPNVELLEVGDDWDELFEEARAVLVPTTEPWSGRTAVREAMLRGLPVLASDLDGLREAKAGVDFLLPPPSEEEAATAWQEALCLLLADEDFLIDLGRDSRQRTLAALANVHEESLEAFLGKVQPRPRPPRQAASANTESRIVITPVEKGEGEEGEEDGELAAVAGAAERAGRADDGPHLSLFFFSADGGGEERRKYRLLHESARLADRHGLTAVWTPERHFNGFGGLYPNPALTSASLATITEHLHLRAGSVVLPLQNPLRVAEEWSVVDNMSGGRVGIAIASGWHVNDFVLAPDNYENRRQVLYDQIRVVQRLWRGETVELDNGAGKPTEVRIFPKPIQPELPIWITGQSDASFAQAGEMGANVLTNMNQKSLDEFASKVKVYREARARVGLDPAAGVVTLMLHTYITEDLEQARDQLKSAYDGYLLTNMGLQMQLAKGTGADVAVGEDDKELIMNLAFERLLQTHGLVGTPAACVEKVAAFHRAGVDEIGCLIDFGLDTDVVLESLDLLGQLRRDCQPIPDRRNT